MIIIRLGKFKLVGVNIPTIITNNLSISICSMLNVCISIKDPYNNTWHLKSSIYFTSLIAALQEIQEILYDNQIR